jgi:type II secretory pathway pseudopilin PulG
LGGLAAVLLGALLVARARKRSRESTARTTVVRQAVDQARQLADTTSMVPTNADPSTVAAWCQVVDGQDATLAASLSTLNPVTTEDPLARVVAGVDGARHSLQDAIVTDRSVRVGPPSPTPEQLGYSAAVIRERATALHHAADDLHATVRQPATV